MLKYTWGKDERTEIIDSSPLLNDSGGSAGIYSGILIQFLIRGDFKWLFLKVLDTHLVSNACFVFPMEKGM